jgi:hypothetical protein
MNMQNLYLFFVMKIYVSRMLCVILPNYAHGYLVSMNSCEPMLVCFYCTSIILIVHEFN